jgi:hypothetical protein
MVTKLTGWTWPEKHRNLPGEKPPFESIMHRSVYERFDVSEVLQYDVRMPYRPKTLAQHIDFVDAYSKDGHRNSNPAAIAEYVED